MNILLIGLGRVGKLVARKLLSRECSGLKWVSAVEQRKDLELFSYLLNHDSTYGMLDPKVSYSDESFKIPGLNKIPLFDDATRAIEETKPDLVIDCSGSHQSAKALIEFNSSTPRLHLFAKAMDVLKTATDSKVWVYGINDTDFQNQIPQHLINPGCLNNCLIPLISCLRTQYRIIKGTFVSVHSITNTQPSLDKAQRSPRWSRASGTNLIPAPHDSMGLVNQFFPDLKDKVIGRTVRAPVSHTSYVTCSFEVQEKTNINSVFNCLADTKISPGVFGVDYDPLVSSDYTTDPRSCVVDGTSVRVIDGSTVLISAWYNNEYAFARRMIDIANKIKQQLRRN